MSGDNEIEQEELETVKSQADTLGIPYRKDIKLETLKARVTEHLAGLEAGNQEAPKEPKEGPDNSEAVPTPVSLKREASKLVRVRVTCMDPNKREYDGEIFCAGNRIVGTHKKYVPFDVEWHVPTIILKMIQRKKCQVFVNKRDSRGRANRESKLIKAYNVEILPNLTKAELDDLARRQAMAKGTAAA